MKHKFLLCLLVCFGMLGCERLRACECGVMEKLSKEQVESYGLVFTGIVIGSEKTATGCITRFKGLQLYHGVAPDTAAVSHDCETSCALIFTPGEEWLIYVRKNGKNIHTEYCFRTRKKPLPDEQDNYTVYSNLTYAEEIVYLEKNFPKKDFAPQEQYNRIDSNTRVIDSVRPMHEASGWGKLVLLGISLVVMILIYLLIRLFWKK